MKLLPTKKKIVIVIASLAIAVAICNEFLSTGVSTMWGRPSSTPPQKSNGIGNLASNVTNSVAILRPLNPSSNQAGHGPIDISSPTPVDTKTNSATNTGKTAETLSGKKALKSSRQLAVTQRFEIEVGVNQLRNVFEKVLKKCASSGFQVINSEITFNEWRDGASITARIPAEDIQSVLDVIGKDGSVKSNKQMAEDKTDAIVDVDAAVQNWTALRDRLRDQINQKALSVKEIIEIERELAELQIKLDAVTGMRQALANEVETTKVEISFYVPKNREENHPLSDAFKDAGKNFVNGAAIGVLILSYILPFLLAAGVVALVMSLYDRKVSQQSGSAADIGGTVKSPEKPLKEGMPT